MCWPFLDGRVPRSRTCTQGRLSTPAEEGIVRERPSLPAGYDPPPDTATHVRELCMAAWPRTKLRKQLTIAKKPDDEQLEALGAAEYEFDRMRYQIELEQLKLEHASAAKIQTMFRRLDAKNHADSLRERRNGARAFQRLVRRHRWNEFVKQGIRENLRGNRPLGSVNRGI